MIALLGPPGEKKLIPKLPPPPPPERSYKADASLPGHAFSPFPHRMITQLSPPTCFGRSLRTGTIRKTYLPSYTTRNINPVLKRAYGDIGLPNASRCISRAFRRGAAQELKAKGAQCPTIASIGDWWSLTFRGYVDVTTDIARDMSRLLAEEVDIASGDDDKAPLWVLAYQYSIPREPVSLGAGAPILLRWYRFCPF